MKSLVNTSIIILLAGLVGFGLASKSGKMPNLVFWEKEKVTPVDYRMLDKEVGQGLDQGQEKEIEQGVDI